MAKKIVPLVKSMLQKKKIDPIVMSEKPHIDVLATDYNMKTIPNHDTMEPSNTQNTTSNNANSAIRLSTRPKKPTSTKLKDFLW